MYDQDVTVWFLRAIQTLSNLVAEIVQCGVVGDEGHVDGAAEEQELGRHLVRDLLVKRLNLGSI